MSERKFYVCQLEKEKLEEIFKSATKYASFYKKEAVRYLLENLVPIHIGSNETDYREQDYPWKPFFSTIFYSAEMNDENILNIDMDGIKIGSEEHKERLQACGYRNIAIYLIPAPFINNSGYPAVPFLEMTQDMLIGKTYAISKYLKYGQFVGSHNQIYCNGFDYDLEKLFDNMQGLHYPAFVTPPTYGDAEWVTEWYKKRSEIPTQTIIENKLENPSTYGTLKFCYFGLYNHNDYNRGGKLERIKKRGYPKFPPEK